MERRVKKGAKKARESERREWMNGDGPHEKRAWMKLEDESAIGRGLGVDISSAWDLICDCYAIV